MLADAALTARLLVRPSGLAGLLAAAAGGVAVAMLTRPWYRLVGEVGMLGESQSRTLDVLSGLTTPWGPLAALAGLVGLVLGLSLAVDRHPGWTRPGLLGSAAALAVAGVVPILLRPGVARFADEDGELAQLRELGEHLPAGVGLGWSVEPGVGPFVTLAAAGVLLVATAAARELANR